MLRHQIREIIKDFTAESFKEKAFNNEFSGWNSSDLIFAANYFKLDFYDTMQILMVYSKQN
jgi:hypothetical protein